MIPELAVSARTFAMDEKFLEGLVGDFTNADWVVKDPVGHDARWLVGHLAVTRRRLMAMVGLVPPVEDWEAAFGRGSSPAQVPEHLDPQPLVQAFRSAQQALAGHWETLTGADLARPLGRTLPDGSDTLGGAVRFLAWHEAYHLGQLGFMRRLAGRPGRA